MLRTSSKSSMFCSSSCRTALRSRRALRCIRGRRLEPTAFAGSSTPDNKKEMFSVRLPLSSLHPAKEPDRKLLVSLEYSRRFFSTSDRGSEKQGTKGGGQVPGNVERTLLLNGKGHGNEEDPPDKEEMARRRTYLCGRLLVVASGVFFIISIYAIVISKLLPATGHRLLDAIREDTHYCYLVPLTIYPSCAALYLSWVSLKFFRHN